jgi:hemerythrin
MSQGQGRNEISSVLDKLDKYVATHFAHEEDCMAKYKCPVAAQNIASHAYFVNTFAELRAEYEAKGPNTVLVMRVQRELAEWFANHIKGIDSQLAPCVRASAA